MIDFGGSPFYRAMACRQYCKEQLRDIPSNELEELVLDLLEKHKEEAINSWVFAFADPENDLFMYGGACDVLTERHEERYTLELVGIRKPKTFTEKIRSIVFGKYPRIEKKAA